MIKVIVTITAFLISLISIAQVSENREISTFSKLKASSGIDVFYTISDKISVQVETDDAEKLKLIKTEVDNGTLILSIDTKEYKKPKNKEKGKKKNKSNIHFINDVEFQVLKITISGPSLEAIKASSSADIKLENLNKSNNLEIKVSSSGSISGSFECANLSVDASSSGDFLGTIAATSIEIESSSSSDVVLSGKATKVLVKASSSSDCDLKKLIVETAIIQASSSADVFINATKSVEAKASSSAAIVIFGNPSEVKKEESSSGSITTK